VQVSDTIPYTTFEDLYLLTALNTYNRRCGWRSYYGTLPRDQVIANADFVIARGVERDQQRALFPHHVWLGAISGLDRPNGSDAPIDLLRSQQSTTPYRALYARRFLERNPMLEPGERRIVAVELLMARVLGGDGRSVEELTQEFPIIRAEGTPARNIYWIGGYGEVIQRADRLIGAHDSRARSPRRRD
jgi:hypothetical protein